MRLLRHIQRPAAAKIPETFSLGGERVRNDASMHDSLAKLT